MKNYLNIESTINSSNTVHSQWPLIKQLENQAFLEELSVTMW